jgi:hypothetical protein
MASNGVGVWVALNNQCKDSVIVIILFSDYITDIKFANSLQNALNFAMEYMNITCLNNIIIMVHQRWIWSSFQNFGFYLISIFNVHPNLEHLKSAWLTDRLTDWLFWWLTDWLTVSLERGSFA